MENQFGKITDECLEMLAVEIDMVHHRLEIPLSHVKAEDWIVLNKELWRVDEIFVSLDGDLTTIEADLTNLNLDRRGYINDSTDANIVNPIVEVATAVPQTTN